VTVETPLDQLAQEINVRLEKADKIEGQARDHRIAAGLLLKEARERLPRGEWGKWLVAHIRRSRQDVYRCLKLVKSDNPAEQQKALQREKAVNRGAVQQHRSNVSYVSDKTPSSGRLLAPDNPLEAIKNLAATLADPLDVIKALTLDLANADLERFKAWLLARFGAPFAGSPQAKVGTEQLPASSDPCVGPTEPRHDDGAGCTADGRPAEPPLNTSGMAAPMAGETTHSHSASLIDAIVASGPSTGGAGVAGIGFAEEAYSSSASAVCNDNLRSTGARNSTKNTPKPSPPAPEPTTPLMTAWGAVPEKDNRATRDWFMRGYAHGEDAPAGTPQSFVDVWLEATEAEKKAFRSEMLPWKAAA